MLPGLTLLVALFAFPVTAHAVQSVPYKMNFQGRLNDASGNPVAPGNYNMKFRIYDAASGGTLLWSEQRANSASTGVTVTNGGLFSVQLGDVASLPVAIFNSATSIYFEIELPTPATATCTTASCESYTEGAMTPRNPLGSSAYAFNADTLDGYDSSYFAVATGGSGYVQNTSSPQAGANFNIGGTGTAGTSLVTPLLQGTTGVGLTINSMTTDALTLDSTTTGNINIGTNANAKTVTIGNVTGATSVVLNAGSGGIALNSNTTVASGKTFTINGSGFDASGKLGVGTVSPSAQLQVAVNSSSTVNPMAIFSQTGAGDATIALNNSTSTSGFYLSNDASSSNSLVINSYSSASSVVPNTPTHVQTITSGTGTTGATTAPSMSLTFGSNNTAGNLIVLTTTWDTGGATSFTCADTRGNTYSSAYIVADSVQNQSLGICYAYNIGAGANTVTVTYNGSPAFRYMTASEYSNVLATSDPFDGNSGNFTTGSAGSDGYTSLTATTATHGDLVFGALFNDSGSSTTFSPGTSYLTYTSRTTGYIDYMVEDGVQSTAGTVAATFSASAAKTYEAYMLAFKPSLSSGTMTDTNANALLTLTQEGRLTLHNQFNNTAAFAIQSATGVSALTVDTANLQVMLGSRSSDPTSNLTPGAMYYNTTSNTFRCYTTTWNDCSAAGPLQGGYDALTSTTTPDIKVNGTHGAVNIQDANTTINGTLFAVRASNGSGLGAALFSVDSKGAVAVKTATNTANAFSVSDSTGYEYASVDTNTGMVGLGKTNAGSGVLFGYNTIGASTDTSDYNSINLSRFQTGASAGATFNMSVYVAAPIDSPGSNNYRLAIYGDSAGSPGALIASTAAGTLTVGWNTLSISATLSPTTYYWLGYITNATSGGSYNNMNYSGGGTSYFQSNTYASGLPSTLGGGTTGSQKFSIYVTFANSLISALQIDSSGHVGIGTISPTAQLHVVGDSLFQAATDSTAIFSIQSSTAAKLFAIDSTNSRVYIGNATPDANAVLLVVDNSSSATDPTGTAGAMYYNTSINRFRCYENSVWKNCTQANPTNNSTATQALTAGTNTYLSGSMIPLPLGGMVGPVGSAQNGTKATWRIVLSKTAAGTTASTIAVVFGTNGTTADTAKCSFSTGTATAAVDWAVVLISVYATGGGASTTLNCNMTLTHASLTTGFSSAAGVNVFATATSFSTAVSGTKMGITVNAGTSSVITVQSVQAVTNNL